VLLGGLIDLVILGGDRGVEASICISTSDTSVPLVVSDMFESLSVTKAGVDLLSLILGGLLGDSVIDPLTRGGLIGGNRNLKPVIAGILGELICTDCIFSCGKSLTKLNTFNGDVGNIDCEFGT
jgi:hypothetical protein